MCWIANQIDSWCSLGTCPPKTKPIKGNHDSFIKKTFWEHPFFEKYSNGPGIVKKWHISKSPKYVLGHVLRSKFHKKVQKEVSKWLIKICHMPRWFKCKFELPKNEINLDLIKNWFCVKIYDLWRLLYLWVDVWNGGWMGGKMGGVMSNH